MFNATREQINSTIEKAKAAFRLLVNTIAANTGAIEANNITVNNLAAEQKILRNQFAELLEHSRFQVRVTKQTLSRAGHKV